MTRIRQKNVTAAQWSPNGESIGAPDLTQLDNHSFGVNVFSTAEQKSRLQPEVYDRLQATLEHGEALDPTLADAVAEAMKEWALEKGATHYTHVFQPLTGLTAEKHDSFLEPAGDGTAIARFSRQGADPGRARRLLLPDRRRSRHLRGPRLHRLGPDQPRLHPREPERRAALHPDRLRLLDGRGARQQDAAAALDGRALALGDPALRLFGDEQSQARLHHGRARAGVLPDRRAVLLRAPRPADHRPHPVRGQAAQGPRARRPLLRLDPGARPRLHDGLRAGAAEAGRAGQDPPQRGRSRPVRDRPDLRELQRRLRPPAADHAADAERGPPLRPRLPPAREAVRRRQRLRQAQQLVDGHRHRQQPDGARRHPGREHELPVLLRRGDPCGQQAPGPAAGLGGQPRPGPPARRQRGAAGDHLDLPGRRAGQGLRDDRRRGGRSEHARLDPGAGGDGAAAAADARRRPQPHLAVRLHRQQVRVPRPGVEHVARLPQHRAEHDRRRGDRRRWPTRWRASSRAAAIWPRR